MKMRASDRRHAKAVKRAKTLLENPPASYDVFLLKDTIFDMMALKENEVLILKIVLDEISSNDIRLVRDRKLSAGVKKKILKKEFRKGSFEETIIK